MISEGKFYCWKFESVFKLNNGIVELIEKKSHPIIQNKGKKLYIFILVTLGINKDEISQIILVINCKAPLTLNPKNHSYFIFPCLYLVSCLHAFLLVIFSL